MACELNRAHILAALDRATPESQSMEVLGVGRTAIWRTRAAYLEGGLDFALQNLNMAEIEPGSSDAMLATLASRGASHARTHRKRGRHYVR